jgi:hypothetical protein
VCVCARACGYCCRPSPQAGRRPRKAPRVGDAPDGTHGVLPADTLALLRLKVPPAPLLHTMFPGRALEGEQAGAGLGSSRLAVVERLVMEDLVQQAARLHAAATAATAAALPVQGLLAECGSGACGVLALPLYKAKCGAVQRTSVLAGDVCLIIEARTLEEVEARREARASKPTPSKGPSHAHPRPRLPAHPVASWMCRRGCECAGVCVVDAVCVLHPHPSL